MNTSCGKLNHLLIYENVLGWDKKPAYYSWAFYRIINPPLDFPSRLH